EGLPSRFCFNRDFLNSEGPGGGQMHVQAGAADEFGRDEGLFAISPRLYGGGCADAPPCWLWDVVARVDTPNSAPEPTVSPPSPTALPRTLVCASSDPNLLHFIELIDHAGLVESCSNRLAVAGEGDGLTDVSPGVVEARVEECAGASRVVAQLSARGDVAEGERPYLLEVYVQPNTLACNSQLAGLVLTIRFMNANSAPTSLSSLIHMITTTGNGVAPPSPTPLEPSSIARPPGVLTCTA
ncbi:MAG TPA: hypothetical protein VM284_01120, partial [Candidatus Limnocylindria bacterium]|nr:hypothetical protein [Candidatus Limnocylindria bacterium]